MKQYEMEPGKEPPYLTEACDCKADNCYTVTMFKSLDDRYYVGTCQNERCRKKHVRRVMD